VSGSCEQHVFIHLNLPYIQNKRLTTPPNQRYYSLTMSGGLQMTEGATCDASESEAVRTWDQRTSASSFVRSALRLGPSSSRSDFSLGKWDKAATNANQVP
jgi:hypothetical protein